MNFHQAQADLKKIVGTNEIVERLKTMENGARIHANAGVGYENYQPDSGTVIPPKGDDKPTTGSDEGANKEDIENGNDTSKDADDELKVGDLLDKGLGGLFDCETGACINVNFNQDYQRKPKGWESQCEPPSMGSVDGFYYECVQREGIYEYVGYYPQHLAATHEVSRRYVNSRSHADSWLNEGAGEYIVKGYGMKQNGDPNFERPCPTGDRVIKGTSVDYKNSNQKSATTYYPIVHETWYSYMGGARCTYQQVKTVLRIVTELKCHPDAPNGTCGKGTVTEYPPEKCSEIQTTKLGTAFEAACPKYDKRLPKRFQDDRFSSIELCDKDGNKVEIKRTIRGFEIKQDKYGGRTTIVDSNNYKVVGYN